MYESQSVGETDHANARIHSAAPSLAMAWASDILARVITNVCRAESDLSFEPAFVMIGAACATLCSSYIMVYQ